MSLCIPIISIHRSIYLSIYRSIRPYIHISIYPSVYPSIYPSIWMFFNLVWNDVNRYCKYHISRLHPAEHKSWWWSSMNHGDNMPQRTGSVPVIPVFHGYQWPQGLITTPKSAAHPQNGAPFLKAHAVGLEGMENATSAGEPSRET